MLLPHSHLVTKLLMTEIHQRHAQKGIEVLMATTGHTFWLLEGRSIAKSVVHHSVRCARVKPSLFQQIMGNLPAARIQPVRSFMNSGVGFGGPFWIHYKVRGKKPQKCYLAVFCCSATKAVHLKLVSDLTTEAFIQTFYGKKRKVQEAVLQQSNKFLGSEKKLQEPALIIHSEQARETIKTT